MCRIFGYIGEREVEKETLNDVSQKQVFGGPDEQNIVFGKMWALGNNRLSIQGLDGGTQPFFYNDIIYCVFNGEIYNHHFLRNELKELGYHFEDHCDGSLLIPLYLTYGLDFVKKLNGMFAIAIIDRREKEKLIIATDPSGIKSVYYHWSTLTRSLKFSSELDPIFCFKDIPKKVRQDAIDEYLTGKAIWGPNTIYDGIYNIPPSSIIVSVLNSEPKLFQYESDVVCEINYSNFSEAAKDLENLLDEEVSSLMKADVPACVVTSGGLDSSYISALASKYSNNLHSFNIWYEGNWPNDERHYAKEVSDRYGTEHHQVLIKEGEFPELIEKTIAHMGQPNSAPHSVSTYALFNAVKKAGFKVALTGEGADEFFGGYARFSKAIYSTDSQWLDSYLDKLSAIPLEIRNKLYTQDYANNISKTSLLYDLTKNVLAEQTISQGSRIKPLLEFDQISRFPYYILRRVDHLSMANSVEVRVPFCQPKIVSFSRMINDNYKIEGENGKRILYEAARAHLPISILERQKQPFLLPISSMIKKGHVIYEMIMDVFNSLSFKSRNIFREDSVNFLIKEQLSNPSDILAESIWSLFILELWFDKTKAKLEF